MVLENCRIRWHNGISNSRKKNSIMKILLCCGSLALLVAGCNPKPANNDFADSNSPLKTLYKDAFLMGAAMNDDMLVGKDSASAKIVIHHFNAITLENSMKAEAVNPQPGVYNFEMADAFVDFG